MTRLMRTSKTAKLRATLEGGRKQRKSAFDTKLIFALNYVKISKKEGSDSLFSGMTVTPLPP